MCFFEWTTYACGDFKFGNFKAHCEKEHRIGETCGLKLFDTYNRSACGEICGLCNRIRIKNRKIAKTLSDLKRWRKAKRFPTTQEKKQQEIEQTMIEIFDLNIRRSSQRFSKAKTLHQMQPSPFVTFENTTNTTSSTRLLQPTKLNRNQCPDRFCQRSKRVYLLRRHGDPRLVSSSRNSAPGHYLRPFALPQVEAATHWQTFD